MEDFVEIARLPSSTEANILRNELEAAGIAATLEGEATAEWLSHFGPTISGVRLFVGFKDAVRARQIVEMTTDRATGDIAYDDDPLDSPADDDEEDEDEVAPELIRAWRAAIIGVIFFPPILNIYSVYVLMREGFFLDSPQPRNWRIAATCVVNLIVFLLVAAFFGLSQSP